MANYTMHHLNVGSNTYEIVDEQGRANIASSFSTSTTYAAGDYVIYGGKLYQFTSAHTGAWTGTDAEECTVTEKLATNTQDISNLKDGFDDLDDRVTALEQGSGSGLTEAIKQALLQIAEKVVYIDAHGQDYYDDLYDALYAVTAITINAQSIMLTSIGGTQQLIATTTPEGGAVTWVSSNTSVATVSSTGLVTSTGYGSCTVTASSGSVSASCAVAVSQVTLTSIAADYQQSGTVYDTASLDSLKSDLTVLATYSDSSTATVTEYTLSGTLTVGTSTITVSYGGKTTTFSVTVTAAPTLSSISAVYTQSGTVYDTDSIDTLKSDLVVTATYSDSSTETVTTYTLSGTLTEGTSTVTVSYGGKTTTFNVTVSHTDVPSGYTQYDYITYDYEFGQSNVKNAIKTDIAMTSEYIFDISFSYKNDGGGAQNQTECVCGSRSAASGTKEFALFVNRTTKKLGYWYGGIDTTKTINLAQGVVNHVIVQPVGVSEEYPNNATINLNGTDYDTGSTTTGATWSSWFSFFGYGSSATGAAADNAFELKIGRTRIKDLNDNTLYDFIPAYNGTNYGLYERINENFYIGQTPSHFICGNWSQGA